MIFYVRGQHADGSEIYIGSDEAIEENKSNEIIEKLEVTIDQHFAIEISPSGTESENLSQIRFRVGGSYSKPQLFRDLAEKLVRARPDSL